MRACGSSSAGVRTYDRAGRRAPDVYVKGNRRIPRPITLPPAMPNRAQPFPALRGYLRGGDRRRRAEQPRPDLGRR
jgi:hypothetical protein